MGNEMMIGLAHIDDPAAASAAKRAIDFFDVPAAAIWMADKDDDKGTPGGNDGDGDSENIGFLKSILSTHCNDL